jgi:hypothetical protein
MGTAIKTLIIINFIAAIAICFNILTVYSVRTEYRNLYLAEKSVNKDNTDKWTELYDKLQKQYSEIQTQLDSETRSKNAFEADLTKTRDDLKNQEGVNTQLKAEVSKKEVLLTEKENDIKNLNQKVDNLTLEKDKQTQIADMAKTNEQDAIAKLNRVVTLNTESKLQSETLKKQLGESIQKNEEKDYILGKIKTKLGKDISEIIVDGDLDKNPIKPIEAKIIASIPEQNLVMLSVGKAEEVKVGYKFTVFRQGDYIGKVEVIEIHPNMCAGRVLVELNNAKGLKMERGDDAKTGL